MTCREQTFPSRRIGTRSSTNGVRNANRVIAEFQKHAVAPSKPDIGRTKLGEKLGKTRSRIVALMSEYPKIAITVLADRIGITTTAVEKQIVLLKRQRIIKRVGPAKGGHWEVSK